MLNLLAEKYSTPRDSINEFVVLCLSIRMSLNKFDIVYSTTPCTVASGIHINLQILSKAQKRELDNFCSFNNLAVPTDNAVVCNKVIQLFVQLDKRIKKRLSTYFVLHSSAYTEME